MIASNQKLSTYEMIDAFLISAILTDEICFSGRYIIFYFFLLLAKYLLNKKYKFSISICWLGIVMFYTCILGTVISNNSANFSVVYNIIIFSSAILVNLILLNYRLKFNLFIQKIVIITSVISIVIILYRESQVLIFRLSDYFKGKIGYRLGISSDINPNVIAWLIGICGMFTLYFLIFEKNKKMFPILILQIFVIFLTGSKSGLLFIAIPLIYLFIKSLINVNIKYLIFSIIIFTAFWVLIHENQTLYALLGKRIDSMLFSIFNTSLDGTSSVHIDSTSTVKRIEMIEYAKKMFLIHPIFGWGIGAFAIKSGFGYYSHNNYMEILVSGGIVAFITYYSIFIYYIVNIIKIKTFYMKDLSIIILISIFISDLSTVNFYSRLMFLFPKIVLFSICSLFLIRDVKVITK